MNMANIRLQIENSYNLYFTPCWQVDYVKNFSISCFKRSPFKNPCGYYLMKLLGCAMVQSHRDHSVELYFLSVMLRFSPSAVQTY